ncbi:MAG: hypothetical protein CMH49_03265 [Myxococcales bacterium]|nr:hypothetical protein [Myxococcales bacterium]
MYIIEKKKKKKKCDNKRKEKKKKAKQNVGNYLNQFSLLMTLTSTPELAAPATEILVSLTVVSTLTMNWGGGKCTRPRTVGMFRRDQGGLAEFTTGHGSTRWIQDKYIREENL